MKKILLLFIAAAAALITTASEYRVLVLGDIHFENAKYHVYPGVKYLTKHSKAYENMWLKAMPELFTTSAKLLNKDVPFIVQLGDFTQGYLALKEERAKMLTDAINAVKSYYPDRKIFFTKGNHDVKVHGPKMIKDKDGKLVAQTAKNKKGKEVVQITQGQDNKTFSEAALPLMGIEPDKNPGSNFAFRNGEDLYIFYDGMIKARTSLKFLQDTLKKYPKNRYVFFITHLPVFPCTSAATYWLLANRKQVADLLFQHNTVILAAHTHLPSILKISNGKNSITQIVVSSIGYAWNTGKPFEIRWKDFDAMEKHLGEKAGTPKFKAALDFAKSYKIESFEAFNNATGFVYLKVGANGVDAEIYNNTSGTPAAVKKLK